MRKKRTQTTKAKIVSAAWKLFYEQGYEDTTVDDIVYESGTSKGSFYHYFSSKDALLSSLSYLFDEKYAELTEELTPDMTAVDKLLFLNYELFRLIENSISIELHIMVEHGVNLGAVGNSIISEVRYVVTKSTGTQVRDVNVCVDSIVIG